MNGIARCMIIACVAFALVLMAGPSLFFGLPLPILGMGALLLIPAFVLVVMVSPFLVVALIANALLSRPRAQLQSATPSPTPSQPVANRGRQQLPHNRDKGPVDKLIAEAETKVDAMRAHARRIPKPSVRSQALEICAIADRILVTLPETKDERLARDVVTRYFTPAETILSRYARLATREVASAGAALTRVEEEDLPLIERKLTDFYDRLHRGDLIDLEVAREMLAFDFPNATNQTVQVSTVRA